MNYDIYVDESCHLENDGMPIMCIGYIKVDKNEYYSVKKELKNLFKLHRHNKELKWSKFSRVRLDFYKSLIDYFFDSNLEFRSILIKYKSRLNHNEFNKGSHDNFYYKMIYYLLKPNQIKGNSNRVFIDYKDTRGREKLEKIRQVFKNEFLKNSSFEYFQHIHSDDNILLQLADFFIGAITYKSRVVLENINNPIKSKLELIKYLEYKSGFLIDEGTEPWEKKFNIFDHQPRNK